MNNSRLDVRRHRARDHPAVLSVNHAWTDVRKLEPFRPSIRYALVCDNRIRTPGDFESVLDTVAVRIRKKRRCAVDVDFQCVGETIAVRIARRVGDEIAADKSGRWRVVKPDAIACTTAEVQPAGAGSHGIRRVGGKNVVGQGRSGDAKRDGRVRGIDEEGREIRGRERREVRRGASEGVKSERIGVVPQQKKSVARFCGHEGGNARRRIKPAVSVPDGVRGRGGIGVEAYEAVAQFTAVAEKRASDVADGPVVGAQGRKRHLYFGQSVSPDVYAHHADYIVGKRHPRHCGEGKGSGAYSHFSVVVHATPLCLKYRNAVSISFLLRGAKKGQVCIASTPLALADRVCLILIR